MMPLDITYGLIKRRHEVVVGVFYPDVPTVVTPGLSKLEEAQVTITGWVLIYLLSTRKGQHSRSIDEKSTAKKNYCLCLRFTSNSIYDKYLILVNKTFTFDTKEKPKRNTSQFKF